MTNDEHRVLEMLVASADGYTGALLLGYGCKLEMALGLVGTGLATATAERVSRRRDTPSRSPGADHGGRPARAGGS